MKLKNHLALRALLLKGGEFNSSPIKGKCPQDKGVKKLRERQNKCLLNPETSGGESLPAAGRVKALKQSFSR
ncbi:hypothetical protein [Roseivirga spongicola]|uniref:hypothetical protein n=1 Tax=Roseivirga spongicola TaxID=333140 RepID=UPI002AC92407|nr:hypothetical protein [Roseivirga spongicola]WPZ09018.1 hypothetical protein T7867_12200 [Roseivirga spongicola]